MKLLAHKFNSFSSDIITVHDAIRYKKNNPDYWEGHDFYDIIKLRPMRPTDRGDESSSFSFINNQNKKGHKKGSKGIAHELVQEYLCKKQQYTFKIFNQKITLTIKNAFDEWYVYDPENTNRKAFIDCCFELDKSCQWYNILGPRVGFEVTDKHKTTNRKKKLLEDLGLFVFELETINDWHINNDANVTKEDIYLLRGRIKGYLKSVQHMKLLSAPNYVDFTQMDE